MQRKKGLEPWDAIHAIQEVVVPIKYMARGRGWLVGTSIATGHAILTDAQLAALNKEKRQRFEQETAAISGDAETTAQTIREAGGKAARVGPESVRNELAARTALVYCDLHHARKLEELAATRVTNAREVQRVVETLFELGRVRPASIGQASRISGITPADIAVLLVWMKKGSAE
jgi:hypothetical protein